MPSESFASRKAHAGIRAFNMHISHGFLSGATLTDNALAVPRNKCNLSKHPPEMGSLGLRLAYPRKHSGDDEGDERPLLRSGHRPAETVVRSSASSMRSRQSGTLLRCFYT